VKNVVLVYREFRNISNIGEALTKFGENIFLTTDLSNGIQFLNFERSDLFIIDGSYPIRIDELDLLRKIAVEIVFIERNNIIIENGGVGVILDENKLLEHINHYKKDIGIDIASVKIKKSPNIFYDFESFRDAITGEVRRAKRYRYPLVIVLFKLQEGKFIDKVVRFFASKIREFDSLWIAGGNKFGMVLPHTGWNGAEILTNRLTTQISVELNFPISTLKNTIISFKRIETDLDFISKIREAINGEYYDINRDIDFNIWREELFSEFIEGKTIRIFNRYKGMLISHDSDMILTGGRLELHNIRKLQLTIINSEKATYFHSTTLNKTIRAGVEIIDCKKSHAVLSSFEIIDSSFIKNNIMKLLIEDDINITVSDGNISAVGKISELSLEEISAIFVDIPVFAHDDKLSISFSLNIRGEIHNIIGESSIIETESGRDLSYIDLKLLTSPDENMKISDYLSGKQMQFIRELKNIS
jgi:hypothetical protein